MSRWTRPRVWAWCSASATVATSSADSRNAAAPAASAPPGCSPRCTSRRRSRARRRSGPRRRPGRCWGGRAWRGPGLGQVGLDVPGAGDPLGVGHLDRDRPVELVVMGQVDRPEPASAQPPDHPIAADGRGKVALVLHRVESLDFAPLNRGWTRKSIASGWAFRSRSTRDRNFALSPQVASQVIRPLRRRFLVQRGRKDRFDLRRSGRRAFAFGVGQVLRLIRGTT